MYEKDEVFNEPIGKNNMSKINFENWGLFQKFCILCGCDYYKHEGIGMEKAKKICRNEKSYNLWEKGQKEENIIKINNALNMFNLVIS